MTEPFQSFEPHGADEPNRAVKGGRKGVRIALLAHYEDARVTVHYQSGVSDTGYVTYLDDGWLEIRKDNGELLLIPTTAVRLIKLQEERAVQGAASVLLRPADRDKNEK